MEEDSIGMKRGGMAWHGSSSLLRSAILMSACMTFMIQLLLMAFHNDPIGVAEGAQC